METNNEYKAYMDEYSNILSIAKEKSSALQIRGQFNDHFCPYLQFVTFDALKTEDWPHGIDMNSVYLCFEIDFKNKKVQLHTNGHVYLSPKDKAENSPYKYHAMRGMAEIAASDYGVKKFRKQNFKSTEELFNKMEKYFKSVMGAIIKYTGGYPYKEGIIHADN